MKPSYQPTLPDAGGNITLATKAKQVEAWLAALPAGDALASASLLAAYLRAHNRPEAAPGLRRQLPVLVSAAFQHVLNALSAEFRDMPLPMDPRQLDHVDHALDLLSALAELSKRLILECAGRSPPLFGENPLPGHVGRLLHVQREIMAVCHVCHRQLPDGFWSDVHQTGVFLIESGLAATPDPAHPVSSLSEHYLYLLLEAVADPYHFSWQERIWTLDIVTRHGNLATIGSVQDSVLVGVFGVRADQDKPPFPLSWQNDTAPDCELVLNTAPLVRKLALIISRMAREQAPQQGVAGIQHPAYKDFLQRLKQTWGGAAQRTTARHRPARPAQRKAIMGFYPIYHSLSGTADQAGAGAEIQCQLVNESLGGMALLVAEPSFRLKIGSLVCVSRGQGDAWRDLGVVRWFKTGANGALTFGIKYLHGRMLPVLWSRDGVGESYPGLLAEPDKGQARMVRNLVTPALRLDPLARLEVRRGRERSWLQLAGRQEELAEIDIFRCAAGDESS